MPRAILRTTDQLVDLFVPSESSFHAQAKYGNKTEKCSIFNIFFFQSVPLGWLRIHLNGNYKMLVSHN